MVVVALHDLLVVEAGLEGALEGVLLNGGAGVGHAVHKGQSGPIVSSQGLGAANDLVQRALLRTVLALVRVAAANVHLGRLLGVAVGDQLQGNHVLDAVKVSGRGQALRDELRCCTDR